MIISQRDQEVIRGIMDALIRHDTDGLLELICNKIARPERLWEYMDSLDIAFAEPPDSFIASAHIVEFDDSRGYFIDVPFWEAGHASPSHAYMRLEVDTSGEPHEYNFRTVLVP